MPSNFTTSNPNPDVPEPVPTKLPGPDGSWHSRDHKNLNDRVYATQVFAASLKTTVDQIGPGRALSVERGGTGVTSVADGHVVVGNGVAGFTAIHPYGLQSAIGLKSGFVTFTFVNSAVSEQLKMFESDPAIGGDLRGVWFTSIGPLNDVHIYESHTATDGLGFIARRMSGALHSGTVNARYLALIIPPVIP